MLSVKEQKEIIIQSAITLIRRYIPECYEIGLFGSVARGKYSASSDVDIYLITNTEIEKHTKAELASDLEEIGVDIVFLAKKDLTVNQDYLLVKNILKDRRVLERSDQ